MFSCLALVCLAALASCSTSIIDINPVPIPSKSRVAILFSGQLRSSAVAHSTWQKFFLEAYDCDVYGYFGYKKDEPYETVQRRLDEFKNLYHPVAVSMEVDSDAVFGNITHHHFSKRYEPYGSNLKYPVACLYYYIEKCVKLFELSRGDRNYDWIVRARTDHVIISMLDLNTLEKGFIYIGWLSHLYMLHYIKNEFYLIPGNMPTALSLMHTHSKLSQINSKVSFVDEILFREAIEEEFASITRVTEKLLSYPSRDGVTMLCCNNCKFDWHCSFNISNVRVFDPSLSTEPWYDMHPFQEAAPSDMLMTSCYYNNNCAKCQRLSRDDPIQLNQSP